MTVLPRLFMMVVLLVGVGVIPVRGRLVTIPIVEFGSTVGIMVRVIGVVVVVGGVGCGGGLGEVTEGDGDGCGHV
jgi:hypothetical protein